MKKLTLTTLKKSLGSKTNLELINEIADLYKKFPVVKDYFQAKEGNPEEILKKYKKIIKKEFTIHARGIPKVRLSIAKKAVQYFKKISINPENTVDIMLTFVEEVSNFNNEFGLDGRSNYTSSENMFIDALILAEENDLLADFKTRVDLIIKNATEVSGHLDTLSDHYGHFYEW